MIRNSVAFLLFIAMVAIVACGGVIDGTTEPEPTYRKPMNEMGVSPSYAKDHPGYYSGSHKNFTCNDRCHAVPLANRTAPDSVSGKTHATADRTQICAQCHMDDFNRTSQPSHSQSGASTYCNSCHYSDSFTSHTRINANDFHGYINGNCESCHSGRQPSSHIADGRNSGCASCHAYPSWRPTSGARHDPAVRTGCTECHSRHYAGYECEWCHEGLNPGKWWGGFSHEPQDQRACQACHGDCGDDGGKCDDDGKGDDGKGDDDDWD